MVGCSSVQSRLSPGTRSKPMVYHTTKQCFLLLNTPAPKSSVHPLTMIVPCQSKHSPLSEHYHVPSEYLQSTTTIILAMAMQPLVYSQVGQRSALRQAAFCAQTYLGSDIRFRCPLQCRAIPFSN